MFNILHGRGGEDGTLQGALDALRVPYTGSGVLGSALTMDKIRTKQVWIAAGLADAALRARSSAAPTSSARSRELGLPAVVKPCHEGSSVGITRVRTRADLAGAVELAARYDGEMLIEQMIEGAELTVGILGREALPSIHIVPAGEFYDYHAKYVAEDTQYLCPGLEGRRRDRAARARAGARSSRRARGAGAAST